MPDAHDFRIADVRWPSLVNHRLLAGRDSLEFPIWDYPAEKIHNQVISVGKHHSRYVLI
jgi:hypothetical protein